MKLKIKYVKDAGNNSKERVVITVTNDTDVGWYVLADSTYISEEQISNKVRHTFWFPDKKVKSNDLVVVYTRSGTDSQIENKNGTTSHFFYMGLDKTIWNSNGDCALLLELSDWQFKKVEM